MNRQLKILLISNDPFYMGLFKGFFHIHHYNYDVHEIAKPELSAIIEKTLSLKPELVFLDFHLLEILILNGNIEALGKAVQCHNSPVCGLRRINSGFERVENLSLKFDNILNEPLNVTELKTYVQSKFNENGAYFPERRSGGRRRAMSDRRKQAPRAVVELLPNTEKHNTLQKQGLFFQSSAGTFRIDPQLKSITLGGKAIDLSCKEFLLFEKLASDTERVFSTEEIIRHLWPGHNNATKADLHQYAHLLRKKIEKDPKAPKLIINVKGFGYRLAAEPVNKKLVSVAKLRAENY